MTKRVLFAGLVAALEMFADQVNPSGPWQTVTTPSTVIGETISSGVNADGTSHAYWNNGTNDLTNGCENVGCFVTASSSFSNSPNLNSPTYLGGNEGAAPGDISLSGASRVSATMLAEGAGYNDSNWLGWYDATLNPTQLTAGNVNANWGIIYSGSDGVANVSNFSPTATFGLFFLTNFSRVSQTTVQLVTAIQNSAHFTEASKNTASSGGAASAEQQFALFARSAVASSVIPSEFWVGIEDVGLSQGSDRDYNDMIVHLTLNPVPNPEPTYFLLLSAGFGALAWAHRRLRKSNTEQHSSSAD